MFFSLHISFTVANFANEIYNKLPSLYYFNKYAINLSMRKYISILVLLFGIWGSGVLRAQNTITSIADEGNWSDPAMWVGGVIPGSADNVVIANGAIVYLDVNTKVSNLVVGTTETAVPTYLIIEDGHTLIVEDSCLIRHGISTRPKVIFVGSYVYEEESFIGNGDNTKLIIGGRLIMNATVSGTGGNHNRGSGISLAELAQMELGGDMNLRYNRGFLDAPATATVTLNGTGPQQIYMGHGTQIHFPNLIIESDSVYLSDYYDPSGVIGSVSGNLELRSGRFSNNLRNISVAKNILIEEGTAFYLTGPSTISIKTNTSLTLRGTLVTEHEYGLGGFVPAGTVYLGDEAEIIYSGAESNQKTGFEKLASEANFKKLTFSNSNGTKLDKSISSRGIEITENGELISDNGFTLTVTDNWVNNGTFDWTSGTVRLNGHVTMLQGANAINNLNHLIVGEDGSLTAPSSLTINSNLTLEEGSSLIGDQSITVVGNIGVGPGAEFTAPETLTVGGSLLVDPSGIFDNGHGTYGRVVFNGLVGVRQTSGVKLFKDVTISSPINFAGNDTINGELYIQGGGLSSVSGNLVLNLDKGYVHYLSNGGFGGDSVVFIKKTSHNGYSYLSFPVQTTVGNLKSMGFNHVFRYNENDINLPMYVEEKNNSTLIEPDGKGYACRANFSEPLIKLKAPFNITPANKTVTLYSTNGSNGQPDPSRTSWNLIGNPYPFDLDWDELQSHYTNSVFSSYYISSGDQFIPYVDRVPAGGGRISAMQAVMVYLRRTGSSYSAPFELRKSASLPTHSEYSRLYRKAPIYNVLKLAVSNGKYTDATYVRLTDEATLDFDENKDAFKLKNSGKVPSFYSYLKGVHYAINSVPETFDKFVMPLAFEAKESGTYKITLSEEYPYDLPYELYLEDKVLNVLHPIGSERTYTFTTNLNESPPRFALHFENPVITALEGLEVRFARVFAEGREITVHGYMESPAEISVFDISGRLVVRHSGVDLNNKSFNFKAGNSAGMYIVSVVSGDNTHSERVVLY